MLDARLLAKRYVNMKIKFCIIIAIISLQANALDQEYYLNIYLGMVNAPDINEVRSLIGGFEEAYNFKCLTDGVVDAVFKVLNDKRHGEISVESVSLSQAGKNIECIHQKNLLPSYGQLKLGMYSFEIKNTFSGTSFINNNANEGMLIYTSKKKSPVRCHRINDIYEGEYFLYGAKVLIVSYSFSDWAEGRVGKISKSLKRTLVTKNGGICPST